MTAFPYVPTQAGYSISDGPATVISYKLDGGTSRYRRDTIGATNRVEVQWALEGTDYDAFMLFVKDDLQQGSLPFTIDLLLDQAEMTNHSAQIIPGTLRVTSVTGYIVVVSASLEAYPVDDDDTDEAIVMLYEEYGGEEGVAALLAALSQLVNEDLPDALA